LQKEKDAEGAVEEAVEEEEGKKMGNGEREANG
jgi:hypothetical protein